MEDYTLTTPVTYPPLVSYKVVRLGIDWSAESIAIDLLASDSTRLNTGYAGADAIALIKFMNTANFSTVSMHKRILEKLKTDGKLPPGTVTGAPDAIGV